jgi:uncharacterized caspase-like protein
MKPKEQTWNDTLPHGPLLCALCMGNDKYVAPGQPFDQLNACGNDAKTVAKKVRDLGEDRAHATLLSNLKDKAAMEKALKVFLSQIRQPPRTVLVYFSGHGLQEGDQIFLVPTGASPSNVHELRQQCLSHDDVFRILKQDLQDRPLPDQGEGIFLQPLP